MLEKALRIPVKSSSHLLRIIERYIKQGAKASKKGQQQLSGS